MSLVRKTLGLKLADQISLGGRTLVSLLFFTSLGTSPRIHE